MIKISGDMNVRCDECQEIFTIHQDDFESDGCLTEGPMRDDLMGSQTRYDYIYVGECENCGHTFTVKVSYYEYPEGAYNYEEFDPEGCSILDKPSYKVIYE
jgi:hypothetical protein